MATIKQRSSTTYTCIIRHSQKFLISKAFSDRLSAEEWGNQMDSNVQKILSLTEKDLDNISPTKVLKLGGKSLFQKLNVNINILTLSELIEEYCEQWSGKDVNQIFRARYWKRELGQYPIKGIKPKHIRQQLKVLSDSNIVNSAGNATNKKRSSNTVIRYKAVLSAIFKYAIDNEYLKKSPVNKIKIKATPNKIVRYLSESERERLLEACKASSWDKLYLLVILAITTGMRRSELTNLKWGDIDFEKSLAYLPDTKNGEPRLNPIPLSALNILNEFRQSDEQLIFPSPSKPDRPFEFVKQWKNALSKASILNFRFHDLRHTAASYLVMGGATLHDAAEILGHKSTETTKRYAHLSTEHKVRLINNVMNNIS